MVALRVISLDEVKLHNTKEDCWVIMEGKVYDVTKFLNEHPGGEDVITELAGQEATDAFNDVGHSRDAKEMAKDYLIGQLEENVKITNEPVLKQSSCSLKDIIFSPTWTNFLIPTVIGGIVYVVYKGAMRLLV